MDFEKIFPPGAAKIESCRGKLPPRPEQLRLVEQWPYFGMESEIFNPDLPDSFKFRPRGLLLFGDSGTGKSVAAWKAIKNTLDEWEGRGSAPMINCWRSSELGRAITAASRTGEELDVLSWHLRNCGLLFVDDLDKARFTDRVQSELFDIIEFRELYQLPVIITTNTTGAQLAKMFHPNIGPAICNRLARMCHAIDFDDAGFQCDQELAAIQGEISTDLSYAQKTES